MGGNFAVFLLFVLMHETIPANSDATSKKKFLSAINNNKPRALSVGDTVTPFELIPIAEKLIAKVEEPSQGKGIVSSAKSPQHLADKLFEKFFLTKKKIVTLNAFDITGLDALQALALSGEEANLSSFTESQTEAVSMMSFRGQTIAVNIKPKRSKYLLVTKKDQIKLKKKIVLKRTRDKPGLNRKNSKDSSRKPICMWRYLCSSPFNLDTCQIQTDCSNRFRKNAKNSGIDALGIPHRDDEHTQVMKQFRKMVGLTLIDEEVEKILELRIITLAPQQEGKEIERMKSLAEYFNKNIMDKHLKSTTPYSTNTRKKNIQNDSTRDINKETNQTQMEDKTRVVSTTEAYLEITPSSSL